MKPSTQFSMSSPLCANHSHHDSLVCPSGGSASVTIGGVGLDMLSSMVGCVSSRPDAEEVMMDSGSVEGAIVAKEVHDEETVEE